MADPRSSNGKRSTATTHKYQPPRASVCHQPKPLPVEVTRRNIEDTQPLSPHLYPEHPKIAPRPVPPARLNTCQYAPQPPGPYQYYQLPGSRRSACVLAWLRSLNPTTEWTSHDAQRPRPHVAVREVVTSDIFQALRVSCTMGPHGHDASAPPTSHDARRTTTDPSVCARAGLVLPFCLYIPRARAAPSPLHCKFCSTFSV
jgi:hypothetical protein